jgi:hypothetical protein
MNKNVVGLGLLFVAVGLLLSDDKPTDKTIPHKKGASKPQPTPKTFNRKGKKKRTVIILTLLKLY